MSIFTGCHFHGHKYFLVALPCICACWPNGLYNAYGLPDYGQEIDPTASTFFFSFFLFAHELFMSAYLYAVRGKRVKHYKWLLDLNEMLLH